MIEKRVEKKRELIEIKERERIIDEYRKKYVDTSEKYKILESEHKSLKDKYEKLVYSNNILINKY